MIYGNEFKISQFADDTTILLDWCEQTLIAYMETLQYFTNISGLKVNIDKTNIIRLGKGRNDHRKMCPNYKLKWNSELTVLGVHFSTNLYNIQKLNYNVNLIEVKKLLEQRFVLINIRKNCCNQKSGFIKICLSFFFTSKPNRCFLQNIRNIFLSVYLE